MPPSTISWRPACGLTKRINVLGLVVAALFSSAAVIGGGMPEIVSPPVGGAFPFGSSVTLGVEVNGDAPFSYRWRLNGLDIPKIPEVLAGGGLPDAAPVSSTYASPYGLATDVGGNLYLAENSVGGNGMVSVVRKLDSQGALSIVAGNNVFGFSGDGGPATAARLYQPYAVAIDPNGAVYIADTRNNRIRKVSLNGVIETIAGNGSAGFSGDKGQAVNAGLNAPSDVFLDSEGALIVCDAGNNRIRKITAGGQINTVAGNGVSMYAGDGGAATNASLRSPTAAVADASGNIYIADGGNSRVRKVTADGTISTFAGSGQPTGDPQFNLVPSRMAWDPHGNLYMTEASRGLVVIIDRFGRVKVVAGGGTGTTNGGPALSAQLKFPMGIAVNRNSDVFVSLFSTHEIVRIDTRGTIETILSPAEQFPLGDGGEAKTGNFKSPEAVTSDHRGNILIADAADHRLRRIDTNGIMVTLAGTGLPGYSGDGDWATNAALNYPSGVAVNSQGDIFVSDTTNNRIRKITADARISSVVGDGTPGFKGDGGPGISARVSAPTALAIDDFDNLLIVDAGNARIRLLSATGTISTVAGGGASLTTTIATNAVLRLPSGIARDGLGGFFVAEQDGHVVRKVRSDGKISLVAGNGKTNYTGDGGVATNAGLPKPIGLATDRFGNLYISDAGASRIRVVATNGVIDTLIRPETYLDSYQRTNYLINPRGLAMKPDGDLLIVDGLGRRIWGYRTAGDRQFTIPTLTAKSSGDYDVVVSNRFGSVTSRVAQVSVQLPPLVAQYVPETGLRIATHGQPGVTYILESSPELGTGGWLPVYTNDADRSGNWGFDAGLTGADRQRWFRLNVK